jgi:membrane-bound lytic murein transglycosylase D
MMACGGAALRLFAAAAIVPMLLLAGCTTLTLIGPDDAAASATPPTVLRAPDADPVAREGAVPPSVPSDGVGRTESVPAPAVEAEPTKVPVPIDPLQPGVRINLNDHEAETDLWDRVRRGFAVPDLESELVRSQERWYAARPDYVQRMTERGGRYLFHILQELERRRLPTELALLPFIESAFNPEALSSARASGMWQFMPSTGKNFALKQNVFRDDRRAVLASTRAALDYLEQLHDMFGDWHLALAAYNWGEGSVARAIERNRKAGRPTDYTSLKMPNETRNYVPKLQAVKNIVARPESFGLVLPALANHPYFLAVPIERDMDVEVAARLAGMEVDDFRALNPQMNKPVILAAGTPQVLLPYDNANRFVRRLPLHHGALATWTAWVAPKTLRPADAAKQVGMEEAHLREVNQIPQRMLIRAGSTLLVPRSAQRHTDVSEHLAEHATMALAPDGPALRRMSLKAGKRDSVATVARRYGVEAEQIARWNGVGPASMFQPGQAIVVFLAGKYQHKKAGAAVSVVRQSNPAKNSRAAAAAPRLR